MRGGHFHLLFSRKVNVQDKDENWLDEQKGSMTLSLTLWLRLCAPHLQSAWVQGENWWQRKRKKYQRSSLQKTHQWPAKSCQVYSARGLEADISQAIRIGQELGKIKLNGSLFSLCNTSPELKWLKDTQHLPVHHLAVAARLWTFLVMGNLHFIWHGWFQLCRELLFQNIS